MTTIRNGGACDVEAVLALWSHAAGPSRHPGRRADVERLLERDAGALLVAEAHGEVQGTVVVGWDGWRCHLYRLAVTSASRRTGIGAALVAEARRRARAHGAVAIDAMVHRDNVGAVAFWERAGFTIDADDGRWSAPI